MLLTSPVSHSSELWVAHLFQTTSVIDSVQTSTMFDLFLTLIHLLCSTSILCLMALNYGRNSWRFYASSGVWDFPLDNLTQYPVHLRFHHCVFYRYHETTIFLNPIFFLWQINKYKSGTLLETVYKCICSKIEYFVCTMQVYFHCKMYI